MTAPAASLPRRALRALWQRGLAYALRKAIREIRNPIRYSYWYYLAFKSLRTFLFEGRRYRYFYHRYNRTWRSERAIEVPIVWKIVRQNRGRRILEVGNVLSHYFPVGHDRLDKYETAPGVINEDVVDFRPGHLYDLIVSISTLEHVGWDEQPRDPGKIPRAVGNLKSLLAPRGRIVLTLPLAYNPHLDALLRAGTLPFSRRYCFKRVSDDNRWREVSWEEIKNCRFDTPFRRVNGLLICIIEQADRASETQPHGVL